MKKLVALSFLFFSCQHTNDVIPTPDPVTGDGTTIGLNVNVKFLVGKYLYEDNEATIVAKGFDVNNIEKWSSEFHFVGPDDNTLPMAGGYDHYTISLQRWGVTDSRDLTAKQLSDDRADGNQPVTYGLGGKVNLVKKPTVVHTYSNDVKFSLESRAEYEYSDDGRIEKITYFNDYSSAVASQTPSRYQAFTYAGNGYLLSVATFDVPRNTKTIEDTYEYGVDSLVLRINENNHSAGVTGSVDLSTGNSSQETKAVYQFSNGGGFEYNFTASRKNLLSSRETIGTQLCNTGNFTYDRNINPFRHLNYTSFTVDDNFSINNTLTEDVNYVACGFPTLIPLSYDYKYDDMGYPTEKVTHYKGITSTSTSQYTYREFPQ